MIGVVAKLKIQDGKQGEFEQVAKDLMAKSRRTSPAASPVALQGQGPETDYIFMEQYARRGRCVTWPDRLLQAPARPAPFSGAVRKSPIDIVE